MAPPTKKQIADILWHVRYEIEQILIVPAHNQDDWHIRESVYLAMLVHARLLIDFFKQTSRKQDDVLCSDFGFQPAPVPVSEGNWIRLNKDIAHLTYSRLRHTQATRPWPVAEIILPLIDRAAAFASHIVSNPPQGTTEEEIKAWIVLCDELTRASDSAQVAKGAAPGGWRMRR